MSPALIFTTNGEIMALKSNNQEETQTVEQVNFDDLVQSTEATADGTYTTITGKPTEYLPNYELFKAHELDIGDWIEGRPELSIVTKEGKTYDAVHLKVKDDSSEEILDCWANFPRADKEGFVNGLTRDFDFYRNAFDFIYSVLKTRGDKYVLDKNGEEYTKFNRVDFLGFCKLVDQMSKIRVEITEGNPDSEYNSWMITSME
jgi:hypothetical protein